MASKSLPPPRRRYDGAASAWRRKPCSPKAMIAIAFEIFICTFVCNDVVYDICCLLRSCSVDDEFYVVFSCLVHFCFCEFLWAHILSLFHFHPRCVDLKPKEAWPQSCATIVFLLDACLSKIMIGANVCSCLSRLDDWRVSGGALVGWWTSWLAGRRLGHMLYVLPFLSKS